jgi:hypothetical protein
LYNPGVPVEMPISVPPVKGIVPIDQLLGDDEEDTKLLQAMAIEARNFLETFSWCKGIRDAYFGDGVGGVLAIFLFRIEPSSEDVDEWLWVVVGDIPPAYLVVEDSPLPSLALEGYIQEMSKWVKLAKSGKSSSRVIPVNVPATPENARMLEGRLTTLRELILPKFQEAESRRG